MSIVNSKDFKHSLHCLSCAYEDLGYNGKMLCIPKTKTCQPIYPYDWQMRSRIRKNDIIVNSYIKSCEGDNVKIPNIKIEH
jgi:hypothetical protein